MSIQLSDSETANIGLIDAFKRTQLEANEANAQIELLNRKIKRL